MKSEELELSLRTEFESYLKNALAEMRQGVSDFQEKFQTEFEKHKSQLDGVFQDFSARLESDKEIDENFKESVVEHLRLARDEGARITATAIAEAEDMEKEAALAMPSESCRQVRDAINDISAQDSQSTILRSLVEHAAQFTARGAFFIVKNEQFVGWRVFGKEGHLDEQTVREISSPTSAETILSEAVRSLSAIESNYGTYQGDADYLNELEFGRPDRMYAIPLIARGRGVAVLYADYGNHGVSVNIEALETLVRVAGLTVELLAASQGVRSPKEAGQALHYAGETAARETVQPTDENQFEMAQAFVTPASNGFSRTETFENYASPVVGEDFAANEPVEEVQEKTWEAETHLGEPQNEVVVAEDFQSEANRQSEFATEHTEYSDMSAAPEFVGEQVGEPVSSDIWNQSAESTVDAEKETAPQEFSTAPITDFEFASNESFDPPQIQSAEVVPAGADNQFEVVQAEPVQFDRQEADVRSDALLESGRFDSAEQVVMPPQTASAGFDAGGSNYAEQGRESFENGAGKSDVFVAEQVAATVGETVSSTATKNRFNDRNLDLPIEVGEDERRLHNDARRFARLLISEIKLYNEQKVREGREEGDLYNRLREAIERSRDMYDKRVQPPVTSKFDYFHYELVNNLAEGNEEKLGGSYPGATV